MRMRSCLLMVPALLALALPAIACTNVFVRDGAACYVAANLDCSNVVPRIWFVPPGDGQYGRYCYGTDAEQRIAEGGVNAEGLFIGVNALDRDTGWRPDPALPDWEQWEGWYVTGVPDGILANCATVDQAVAVFRAYNLLTLAHVKFLVADAGGASVIIEWRDGELAVLPRGAADYQISTNFVTSAYAPQDVPCERFRIADRLLAADPGAGFASLRGLLSAVHLEFRTPTVVSTICDLGSGRLEVYYFHDFEQPLVYDLHAELARERHGGPLGDLVPVKPYVATVYEQHQR